MQQEYQIKYLRAAMRDLEGIAQLYLGLAGADSAEKFIDEILHTVDLLRTFPYSGALHPDMVLADLNLPGKDGLTVIREACLEKMITTVIITGHYSDHLMEKANISQFERNARG